MSAKPTGLQWLLDPRAGEATAWLVVHERGVEWPRWLADSLPGASLVVVVARQFGEPHRTLRERVHARAAETGLSSHRLTGVYVCSRSSTRSKRRALADVVLEQIVNAPGGRLVSVTVSN